MNKSVVVRVREHCVACTRVLYFLTSLGIPFTKEVVEYGAVPTIFYGNKKLSPPISLQDVNALKKKIDNSK